MMLMRPEPLSFERFGRAQVETTGTEDFISDLWVPVMKQALDPICKCRQIWISSMSFFFFTVIGKFAVEGRQGNAKQDRHKRWK